MKIAVLTGGGDCPGLNAAIRAVVRRAVAFGDKVYGIREGWKGFEALIFIGGEGTIQVGASLSKAGMPVIGIPKTIDNDAWRAAVFFG